MFFRLIKWFFYGIATKTPFVFKSVGTPKCPNSYFISLNKMFCNVFIGWTHKAVRFPGRAFGITSRLAPFAP